MECQVEDRTQEELEETLGVRYYSEDGDYGEDADDDRWTCVDYAIAEGHSDIVQR